MVLLLHEGSALVMNMGFGAGGLGFTLTASAHRALGKLLLSSLDLSFLIRELGVVVVLNARTVVRRNEGVEESGTRSAGPCPVAAAAAALGALPCHPWPLALALGHLSSPLTFQWKICPPPPPAQNWTLQTGVQPALARLRGGPVTPPCWSWVPVHLVPLRGSCDCSAWRSDAALDFPHLPPVTWCWHLMGLLLSLFPFSCYPYDI